MKKDPKTKILYRQELRDFMSKRIQEYEKSSSRETSEDAIDDIQEAQPVQATGSEDALKKAEDFL
ncbi:hypothetical protein H5410_004797 [Solanum commersonii]|uniref:Uncharacterized protein n=1 Tax=Solanum commersonii TaxID=4109 RepID=A0A9J6A5K7_SOLCO|nr:hypothetical protein H5410_004797 [Solanum commersonii]